MNPKLDPLVGKKHCRFCRFYKVKRQIKVLASEDGRQTGRAERTVDTWKLFSRVDLKEVGDYRMTDVKFFSAHSTAKRLNNHKLPRNSLN